jgi:hypothetical protein
MKYKTTPITLIDFLFIPHPSSFIPSLLAECENPGNSRGELQSRYA